MTIAGFDPSAGAGILADIKTFEQHRVQGFAVQTANTIQTEDTFFKIEWTTLDFVIQAMEVLFEKNNIKAVKIGIVPSLCFLKEIVFFIKRLSPKTKIVWDTVLKSSTNFDFLTVENQSLLIEILMQVDLITPNFNEILKLSPKDIHPTKTAKDLSKYCAILLKGGHNPNEIGVDYLYQKNEIIRLPPNKLLPIEKHGTGCVLSAAITANLALELSLEMACKNAKKYIEAYLQSNQTKLGYHYV